MRRLFLGLLLLTNICLAAPSGAPLFPGEMKWGDGRRYLGTASLTWSSPTTFWLTQAESAGFTVDYEGREIVFLCDGTFTVDLDAAATLGDGFSFVIKNVNTGTITIDPNGAELIDGAATFSISTQYDAVQVVTDGTEWYIVEYFQGGGTGINLWKEVGNDLSPVTDGRTVTTNDSTNAGTATWSTDINGDTYIRNSGERSCTGKDCMLNTSSLYLTCNGYECMLNHDGGGSASYGYLTMRDSIAESSAAFGYRSMQNYNGFGSTMMGYRSGMDSSGDYNTGYGWKAQRIAVGGQYNTGIGASSLENNTGDYNTSSGYTNMINNTGNQNTSAGWNSLADNTGSFNNGFGAESGRDWTTNFNNAFGNKALRDSTDTVGQASVMGHGAFQKNEGAAPTGIGYGIGVVNTGDYMTGSGHIAMESNTGDYASGYGYNVMQFSSGDYSTAIGSEALQYSEGDNNTALGARAFTDISLNVGAAQTFAPADVNTATEQITIIGHGFGAPGDYVNLNMSTTGTLPAPLSTQPYKFKIIDVNTIQMMTPRLQLTDGGVGVHTATPLNNITNSTAVGYDAEPTASNQVMLGDTNVTEVYTANDYTAGNDFVCTGATKVDPGFTFAEDTNSGIGKEGSDTVSIIAGGIEVFRASETGSIGTTRFNYKFQMFPLSDETITAAGGLTPGESFEKVQGSGGPVIITATPSIAAGVDGQVLTIIGLSDVNTVTIQDNDNLAGSGVKLDGNVDIVLGADDIIDLIYNSDTGFWCERNRSNN